MPFSRKLPRGVRRLFRLPWSRARLLRDMDEEVGAHIAMRAEELRALGMTEDDAQREALRRFGDADEFHAHVAYRATRQARWNGVFEWFDEWRQDIRFANRQFRRNTALTALAVLTLALGIGANTAIFTVVHRLLLSPLPYADGDRIVMLAMEGDDRSPTQPGRPAMLAWRARAHSVETIAAVAVLATMVQDARELDTIPALVTTNYLQLLGVRPVVGRGFTPDDALPGAIGVAMITYGHWQRVYGGRADALGSPVRANGQTYTIVGVTPPEMGIPMSTAGAGAKLHEATPGIWLPVTFDALAASHSPFVVAAGGAAVFAKLRAGVSTRRASDELQSIIESAPASERFVGWSPWTPHCCARALRAQDLLDPREARAIEVLFAAVGVLLLIACANVANVLMSRAWTRRREFAVRVALGAGRARLARLVLTESVTLALAGGALGVIVAWQTLRVILALRPPALSNLDGVHLALPVLAWSLTISIATGILFGSAPALFAGGRSFGDALRSETRASSSDGVSRRIRSGLIVAEIALSLVLLVGAGLLLRSFVALQRMPLGFEPRGLVAIDFQTRWSAQPGERIALRSAILERLRAAPGVTEAAIGAMPGDPNTAMVPLETEPDADGHTRSVPRFSVTFVSPNYFRVTRISLVEGRSPEQTPAAATEIVVNRSLARRFWPNGRVLGARLHAASEAYTVVGVVDDMHMPGPQPAITSVIYRPPPAIIVPFIARVPTAAPGLAAMLGRAATEADPSASIRVMRIGDDYLRDALAPTRFATALLGAFALLALTLSAVGLYGVIAYSVTQRTREIGIRVALGAAPNAVTSLVVGGGLKLAAAGTLAGAVAAALSTRVLANMLYAVSPADPLTFVVIATIVVTIAALASYVPARRALRIDPADALRAD